MYRDHRNEFGYLGPDRYYCDRCMEFVRGVWERQGFERPRCAVCDSEDLTPEDEWEPTDSEMMRQPQTMPTGGSNRTMKHSNWNRR